MFSKSKRKFIKFISYLSFSSLIFKFQGKIYFKKNVSLIKKKLIKNRVWILASKD